MRGCIPEFRPKILDFQEIRISYIYNLKTFVPKTFVPKKKNFVPKKNFKSV